MKYGARPLILLVVLSACSPDTQTAAERAAAAARADSSAAGYEVGPATSATTALPLPPDSTPRGSTRGPDRVSDRGGSPGLPGSQPVPADTVKLPATSAGSGTAASSGRGGAGASGTGGSVPTTGRGSGQNPGATILPLDPALEPNYIAYDTLRKTVTFQLAAGDEIREQVSFNASQRGGRTLTVPLGWHVTIAFANRDPNLPHSATVVDVSGPIPEELPQPVFLRAQTVRTAEGLLEGDADEVLFTADRVGRYLIACGVLGHAQRGQWITLDVSTTAPRPAYR